MVTEFYTPLYTLFENDRKTAILSVRLEDLKQRRERQIGRAKLENEKLLVLRQRHEALLKGQALQEQRLREEQSKILERRRQLTAMGGVKAAKHLEREADNAARAVQSLEEQTLKAMGDAENIGKQVEEQRGIAESLEAGLNEELAAIEVESAKLVAEIKSLQSVRPALAADVESSMLSLYDRVRKKYPAEAVAIARDQSCTACFRSLPLQVFNLVLTGGKAHQCPGCNRVLLAASSES